LRKSTTAPANKRDIPALTWQQGFDLFVPRQCDFHLRCVRE